MQVLAEANNGLDVQRMVEELKPDVVLMDVSMAIIDGISATREIARRWPDTKVVILSMHAEEGHLFQALQAGAAGYVLKSAEKREIFAAVRAVAGGENFFSPTVSKLIVDGFIRKAKEEKETHPAVASKTRLTGRETEVLKYIAQGLSSPQIAGKLFLSVNTVNTHRNNLMQKLDIHDTAGLVRYAFESGLAELKV